MDFTNNNVVMQLSDIGYGFNFSNPLFTNGVLTDSTSYGKPLLEFINIDLNELASIVNFPIEHSVDYFLKECYNRLSEKYSSWFCACFMNDFQQCVSSHDCNEINGYFQNLALMQISCCKMLSTSISDFNSLSNLQDIQVKFVYNHEKKIMNTFYIFISVYSLISIDLTHIFSNDITIKKCANCGKYFIPKSRSDEIYCDSTFKNNRTCKQVGYENSNEFTKVHRTAYKTQNARIHYNSHNKDYKKNHFDPWYESEKKAKELFEKKSDIDGFKKWIEDNKNSY